MEQTAVPPTQPPPLTTVAHPSSIDSSPRSQTIDSWVENSSIYPNNASTTSTTTATGGSTKLRLMCSSGGHIVPRPHDKSLCYVGGDTRMVVVDRHTTVSDLTNRLTKTILRSSTSSATTPFTIKYQLPSEDLDSLISVTTDEDLENMIDEYDRLNLTSSSRIRLFLFPVKPESVSSIGSLLESVTKSEDWFLNALNGTTSLTFSDTSSVNCLLGLEDDVPVPEKKDLSNKYVIRKSLRTNNSVQDIQSVPDSPMLETTSSFGSASSTPSLTNVPTVTVHVDDLQKVKHEDVSFVVEPVPVGSTVAITENINPDSSRVLPDYQPKPLADSASSDGSMPNSQSSQKPSVIYQDPAVHTQFPSNNIIDQNARIQIQQQKVQDSAHLPTTLPSTPTTPVDPHNHQMHFQPQFIHTAVPPPQYLPHHHHPPGMVPMAPYYQIYPPQTQYHSPHPALDQHNMVYYMPARQPQPPLGYNLPVQADASPAVSAPPNNQIPPPSGLLTTPRAAQPATKTEPPVGVYGTATNSSAMTRQPVPVPVPVPSSHQQIQPQFVGYSPIHQASRPAVSGGNYVYGFADPSQQGQRIYYAAQPLPPQTIAATLPVEAQAGSSLQQVRTSQP